MNRVSLAIVVLFLSLLLLTIDLGKKGLVIVNTSHVDVGVTCPGDEGSANFSVESRYNDVILQPYICADSTSFDCLECITLESTNPTTIRVHWKVRADKTPTSTMRWDFVMQARRKFLWFELNDQVHLQVRSNVVERYQG